MSAYNFPRGTWSAAESGIVNARTVVQDAICTGLSGRAVYLAVSVLRDLHEYLEPMLLALLDGLQADLDRSAGGKPRTDESGTEPSGGTPDRPGMREHARGHTWPMDPLPVLAPMLAAAGSLPLPGGDERWAVETKQDGQRAVVYLPGDGTLTIRSRGGHTVTAAYPELHGLSAALGGRSAVLDGEIIAPDVEGRPDFELLQTRMGLTRRPDRAAHRALRVPVHLAVFDLLLLDGQHLTGRPWSERREILTGLGLHGPAWSVPAAVFDHAAAALDATKAAGLEGIVCKKLTSLYRPGVRSTDWLKIKNVRTTDAVIGGWVPGTGRLAGVPGAVILGELRDGLLRYTGSVGTGWSDRERRQLAGLLAVAAWPTCPFIPAPKIRGARWVLPRLVAEITYTTRTRTGYLRHPSWHRLRPDLAPDDLT